jgi:hypothetical protein
MLRRTNFIGVVLALVVLLVGTSSVVAQGGGGGGDRLTGCMECHNDTTVITGKQAALLV